MCGRYSLFTGDELAEIQQIIRQVDGQIKTGEIFPTNQAPILVAQGDSLAAQAVGWGFPRFGSSGVIINARSETAGEKRTFKNCLTARRCVVPSTGFYEWDGQKQKFQFREPGRGVLYMAGLYNDFDGERRFVILTTAANASMADIHDRMPVILQRGELLDWVGSLGKAMGILGRTPQALERAAV